MAILNLWRSPTPGSPSQINQSSILSKGLKFAFSGHHGIDLLSGTRPTSTSVTRSTNANCRGWTFTGGAEGDSDLNFGTVAATADLHEHPATWAFYCTAASAGATCLAAQNDGNAVDRGWQVGGVNNNIGMSMERSGTNINSAITETVPANTPFTLVVTSLGTDVAADISIYLNGLPGTPTGQTAGSGTTGPATAQNLYLGRRRFVGAASHSGDIFVALIADRIWSAAEITSFHNNPYQVFQSPGLQLPAYVEVIGSGTIGGTTAITIAHASLLKGAGGLIGSTALTFTCGLTYGVTQGAGTITIGSASLLSGVAGLIGSSAATFIGGLRYGTAAQASMQFGSTAVLAGRGTLVGSRSIAFGASLTYSNPDAELSYIFSDMKFVITGSNKHSPLVGSYSEYAKE